MPIYQFLHPKTEEVFEDLRPFKDMDKPFHAPDGVKCKRILVPTSLRCWRIDRESFEADSAFVKQTKPKYIKFRDGHRERYDPTKHC